MKKNEMANKIEALSGELLHQWCDSLLKLQVKGTGNPRLDGGILCPACGMIHGRCIDAVYPFMRMAKEASARDDREESRKWVQAAKELLNWADQTIHQKKGAYWNDIGTAWTGTTVFFASALADALWFHGDLLSEQERADWQERLRQAAEYIATYEGIVHNNINYPLSDALALYECGVVLGEMKYQEKAAELAEIAFGQISANGLLIGEGVPWTKISARGCNPVDIGYNVEETVPCLLLYGRLSGNGKVENLAKRYMRAHLDFMLEDGAWDNSFGTRNFKWSYWGSRTCDGSALGCLLLDDQDSNNQDFRGMEAAWRSLCLLKQCTKDGLLYGGRHYAEAGQPPCSHHTFCHAKVLAEILDREELWNPKQAEKPGNLATVEAPELDAEMSGLPVQQGIREYQELSIYRLFTPSVTATVTAYDWEYMKGGHVSGGTLSMVHHKTLGTLLCAGMAEYIQKEPANMQTPWQTNHECLAPRIEIVRNGEVYSSVYETEAQVTVCEIGKNQYQVCVKGQLKNQNHHSWKENGDSYQLCYHISENGIQIEAECSGGTWICPVISCGTEEIQLAPRKVTVKKEYGAVQITSDQLIKLPYGTERIFNLIPGFQAIKTEIELKDQKAIWNMTWGI